MLSRRQIGGRQPFFGQQRPVRSPANDRPFGNPSQPLVSLFSIFYGSRLTDQPIAHIAILLGDRDVDLDPWKPPFDFSCQGDQQGRVAGEFGRLKVPQDEFDDSLPDAAGDVIRMDEAQAAVRRLGS